MNKIFIGLSMLFCVFNYAQVGINTSTPNASSALDIVSTNKGILIPRVELTGTDQQLTANIPNADGLLVYHEGNAFLPKGFYYWNSTVWVSMTGEIKAGQKFFYMPSISIDTRNNAVGLKRDLYKEYVAQFTNKEVVPNATNTGFDLVAPAQGSSRFISSTNAPTTIPIIPSENDLYYYVTYYDNTALKIHSIDEKGMMNYDVIGSGTDYSFVNVVFVVK